MSVLTIRVDDIRDKVTEISEELPVASLPLLAGMMASGEVTVTTPVQVEVSAEREYDHIRVRGRVTGGIRLSCSRCLTEIDEQVGSSFEIFYTKSRVREAVPDEEIELSDVDLVSVSYSGDTIDLTPEVEEQFVMEIPLKPLCSEGCRGLCSSCGADLNQGECGCNRVVSLAFGSLKDLKIP